MTRRDVVIALVTAGAVYAATMYGGPLAGKAAKVVVPPVVERVADRIEQKPLEEPPVWAVQDQAEHQVRVFRAEVAACRESRARLTKARVPVAGGLYPLHPP